MAIEFKNPADAVLEQGLKILLYGAAGSGKTVTCATAGESTLIISAEAGLLSIKDAPGDIQIAEVNTRAEVEAVLDYLEQKGTPAWVCIDSISEIGEIVLAEEMSKTKNGIKAYGELAIIMTALIKRFRALHCNVVMTAKLERTKDDAGGTILFGPSMPGKRMSQEIPYYFDLVCAMRVGHSPKDSEKMLREIQTNRDGQWEAKDRSGKLDIFEPQNLAELKKKILGKPPKLKAV